MDDILKNKDEKKNTIVLFLDLSAAFDTIDHDVLLTRLKNKYGVSGKVLKLIESYLSERVFYVVTGNGKSKGK